MINLGKVAEAKQLIRDFNLNNDITQHNHITMGGKTYKWVDEAAKEKWDFVGLNDSDVVDMLDNKYWFKEVGDE